MDDKYPELSSRRHILHGINDQLEQAYEAGESILTLRLDEVPKLGEGIQLNQAKTNAMVKQLIDEGNLRARVNVAPAWMAMPSTITFLSITDRGLSEIGVMPNPDQRLISAFQTLVDRVEEDPSIPEPQKRSVVEWLNQGISLVRAVEGIADLLSKHI